MEEMLGNIAGCREVFERWIDWQPEESVWKSFINFEMRYKEVERAIAIYERFLTIHPEANNWIKYAKFLESNGLFEETRRVYEAAAEETQSEDVFIAYAKFEEGRNENERACSIYSLGLEYLRPENAFKLYDAFATFTKKYGSYPEVEGVIATKRLYLYAKAVGENPPASQVTAKIN